VSWSSPIWLTPTVALVGVAVAISAVWWNRHIARLKATADLIEGSESKQYYQDRYEAFRDYRRSDDQQRNAIADPDNNETHSIRSKCLDFLNHYELVSICCRRGLINERFYRDWMGPTFVRDWNEASILVSRARKPRDAGQQGNPKAYVEFERMARRWGGRPLPS
jgi:hypothetical protein